MCRYTGGFQGGCVVCLHPSHPASQQLHLDLQSTKGFHAFWFTPLLLCTSGGGLWLDFPSWVHLKFPGWDTDNKGAVTLGTSAAKCSPGVLGRFAQSVQKYCCQHLSWQLKVTQIWAAVTPLDHGNVPIFTASSALESISSCWNFRSQMLWRAQDCRKVLKELHHPRAPHCYVSGAYCTSSLCLLCR